MRRTRGAHAAHRSAARHARNHAHNRDHRHLTLLISEPYGSMAMPIVFSEGAYEQACDWIVSELGSVAIMGGPLIGWCRCDAPDPRARGLGRPYWQVPVWGPENADAIRAQHEAELAEIMERIAAGEDPFWNRLRGESPDPGRLDAMPASARAGDGPAA